MIEIRKRRFGGYWTTYDLNGEKKTRVPDYTLWVVVRDGKRVDSFLKKRHALRCALEIADLPPGPPPGTQSATPD